MKKTRTIPWLWVGVGLLLLIATGGSRFLTSSIALFFDILPLLVFGYMFYFVYNTSKHRQSRPTFKGNNQNFVELLVYILVQIGKTDGQLTQTETRVIYGFFQTQMHYMEIDLKWIASLVEKGNDTPMSLEKLCQEFNTSFPYEAKLLLLDLIGQIISSDGRLSENEKQAAESVLSYLHIGEKEAYRFRQLYLSNSQYATQTNSQKHHYDVLGIREGASQAEIKKAYRDACKQHHPDKVHHLGPEFRRIAEEKMQAINKAYNALSKTP